MKYVRGKESDAFIMNEWIYKSRRKTRQSVVLFNASFRLNNISQKQRNCLW